MAKYKRFEQLPVWQEAAKLYNQVLDLLAEPGVPCHRDSRISLIGPRFLSRVISPLQFTRSAPGPR